jgi:flagellar biosynthesis/type III secretory pathway chaperone
MMTVLVAKLNDKIVEIVRVVETVQFSNEKNWILISHQISKKDSLQVKWLQASKVKFDWVRSFKL